MKIIQTLEELDEMLLKLDAAQQVSDDELRRLFPTFRMNFDLHVPEDPSSDEYAKYQFDLYRRISGKTYTVENEKSTFDLVSAVLRPFPYYTGSCETVGNQLVAIGHIIKSLDLKTGTKIVEFGPGWGNTTIALAMMGFDVTAVDIEKNFCDLIKRRAENHGVDIEVINADFSWIEQIKDPVDAILFFESFHHASDHVRIIKALKNSVKEGGKVLFAAEPITPDFPIPWGLRLDGESLWAIRKFGWLELGYSEDYFVKTLRKYGWSVEKLMFDHPWSTIYKATILSANFKKYLVNDPKIYSQIGIRNNNNILVSNGLAGYLVYGPYVYLQAGKYIANIYLSDTTSLMGNGYIDVSCRKGEVILAKKAIVFKNLSGSDKIQIEFYTDKDESDIEVRLLCYEKSRVKVSAVEIMNKSKKNSN